MPAFDRDILAGALIEAVDVVVGGGREGQRQLASFRQRNAPCSRLRPGPFDKLFALRSREAFALLSDNPVNSLPIDHEVDRIPEIAIGQALRRDPVLAEFLAWLQPADPGAVKLGTAERHRGILYCDLVKEDGAYVSPNLSLMRPMVASPSHSRIICVTDPNVSSASALAMARHVDSPRDFPKNDISAATSAGSLPRGGGGITEASPSGFMAASKASAALATWPKT